MVVLTYLSGMLLASLHVITWDLVVLVGAVAFVLAFVYELVNSTSADDG